LKLEAGEPQDSQLNTKPWRPFPAMVTFQGFYC